MTTTEPRVQPFRIYRMWDGSGRLLYIGQTGRMPLARCTEHLYTQAWGGDVCRWELDPREWWSEDEVLAAEAAAIRSEKPIRNWVGNAGPHRQWQPPVAGYRHPGRVRRQTSSNSVQPSRAGRVLRSPWTWWAAVWLVLSLAAAVGLARVADVGWRWHAGLSTGVPLVALLWLRFGKRGLPRWWRRRRR